MLQIIYAPNDIFKRKANKLAQVDDQIRLLANEMLQTMYLEGAVGIAANMVGLDFQIITIDLQTDGIKQPYVMINPQIIESSKELQEFEEASISFPGISAMITRPRQVTVSYLDLDNQSQILTAEGFLSTVIQHEMDYLQGVVYLDKLSKLKRDMLMKKMLKFTKNHPPHIHGAHCHH